MISIGLTEKTNEYMASNYKQYFKQQYFDSHGMFISFVYSAPVLVNCVIILVRNYALSNHHLFIFTNFILDQLVQLLYATSSQC